MRKSSIKTDVFIDKIIDKCYTFGMGKKPSIDLSKLTEEERDYVLSLQRELADKRLESASREAKLREAESKIAASERKIRAYEKALMSEKWIVRKYNLERFFSKSDNAGKAYSDLASARRSQHGVPFSASPKKKPGRSKGSPNFGGDYLSSLAAKNEPITVDVAESLLLSNPSLTLKKIRDERTYLIKRAAAHIEVREVIIPIYKGSDGAIYRGKSPSPLDHSMISSSLLSDSIAMKYFLGVPEDRYAKWLAAEGLPFSQRTLNNWAISSAEALEGFAAGIKSLFAEKAYGVSNVHIDETTLGVIENRKEGRSKSYVFAYSAKSGKGMVRYYDFSTSRETSKTKGILKGYSGAITVDGYSGYDDIKSAEIKIQRCLVHARRKFADITKTIDDPKTLKGSVAYEAIRRINLVFAEEKRLREQNVTGEELVKARMGKDYLNLVFSINSYIRGITPEKGSPLAKAINYWNGLCPELWTYLRDASLTPDNNEAERQVKKFVIDRKNFLFSRTERGAKASCILMTLVDIASENWVDPRGYIEFLLDNREKLPFEDLLPWSGKIPESIKIPRKSRPV